VRDYPPPSIYSRSYRCKEIPYGLEAAPCSPFAPLHAVCYIIPQLASHNPQLATRNSHPATRNAHISNFLNPKSAIERFPIPHSHFPLPTSTFPLPTSAFPLPTSAFPLPTSAFPLPTSSYPTPFPLKIGFRQNCYCNLQLIELIIEWFWVQSDSLRSAPHL